uniref:Uncharacterized protein n=1 Tax=Manihot esculenta TaxID=3983 RepID=A0A2C9WFJ4_MANES
MGFINFCCNSFLFLFIHFSYLALLRELLFFGGNDSP